jgi:hypothetical protein
MSAAGYEFPTNGLVAKYLFEGNADDTSGNGYDATVFGATPTTDRLGAANSAYSYNGSSDYIRIDDPSAIKTATEGSIVAWIKPASISAPMAIFSAGYSGGTADYITFYIDSDGKFNLLQRNNSDVTSHIRSDDILFSAGVYAFVVITSDGNQWKLYVDGVLKSISAITGSNNGDWFGDITTPSPDKFDWGILHQDGTNYWHLDGVEDIGLIYDRPLTQIETTDMHNGTKP